MVRSLSSELDLLCLAGKRVLIVDDDGDSRELLRCVLESCGMAVFEADDAEEALRALDRKLFDIIISDIGMPAMDGYMLIRAVRDRRDSACVLAVAVTAFVRAEDRARATRAGFDLHFGKPVDPASLVRALAALLRAARPHNTE
jgi:CheY-like chemotaxis protein